MMVKTPSGKVGHRYLHVNQRNKMQNEDEDLSHQIRPGSLQHHILKCLKDSDPKDADAIWGALLPQKIRLISLDDLRNNYLKSMRLSDLVSQNGHLFALTLNGYAMLNFLNLKAGTRRSVTTVVSRAAFQASGVYTGEELKGTCLRKGAYDYLSLPSRMGGELVPHPQAHLSEG